MLTFIKLIWQALAEVIVLCSWVRYFALTGPLSTQSMGLYNPTDFYVSDLGIYFSKGLFSKVYSIYLPNHVRPTDHIILTWEKISTLCPSSCNFFNIFSSSTSLPEARVKVGESKLPLMPRGASW